MNIEDLTPKQQVKIRRWLEIIHQCRSSGLSNKVWCKQNDVSLKSYYYWIAKIRRLALADLPPRSQFVPMPLDVQSAQLPAQSPVETTFVELPVSPVQSPVTSDADLMIRIGDIELKVTSATTPELLQMVLKVVRSC